jgi:hypothetical protein
MSTETKNGKHRYAQTYRCAIICTCLCYLLPSIASNNLGWHEYNIGVSCFPPATVHQLISPHKDILVYMVVSKILRTDAVKIIKLTIRPIGRHHHPRSSSLLHVDIGPTVSSIFRTLPGSPFLSECQAFSAIRVDLLNGIKPASFQLQFHFLK